MGWETALSIRPELFIHLRGVIDAVELLIARPSGAAGHVTVEDITTYYYRVSDSGYTIKQFIKLFNTAELLLRKRKMAE